MAKKKRSKFGVDLSPKGKEQRTYEGVLYDSKTELQFYLEWILPKMGSGEIVKCERQIPFILQEGFKRDGKSVLPITYISDYVVTYDTGHVQVIDVKGSPDNISLLKRKLFWNRYKDTDYVWYVRSIIDGGWCFYEDVKKARRERKKAKSNK